MLSKWGRGALGSIMLQGLLYIRPEINRACTALWSAQGIAAVRE